MNKIIVYIATSKDGFIADKDGGIDWLPQPKNDHDLEVVGYQKLMKRIDIILMGSKSYKQIKDFGEWAWTDKQTYVFSSRTQENLLPCITITNNSPNDFMKKIKNRSSDKDIWLLGGSELIKSFEHYGLIDEIILAIIPKNLGEGIPLGITLDDYDLRSEHSLMDNMLQRVYLKKI
jgi:dihydrofolate reductase